MEIDIIGLISACSYALDCIEAELVNIKNKHGKRVAYISVRMGQYFDLPEDALQDLAICALLHDNALTQYISEVNRILQKSLLKLTLPMQSYTIMSTRTAPDHFTKNGMKFLCLRALSTLPMWWISSGTAVHLKHRDGIW